VLVVTRESLPLGYEVFAGNRTDVTTVEEIVETMESRFGIANRARGTRALIESAKLCGVEPRAYLREAALRAVRNPGTVTLARYRKSPEA
jgi:hypothetical protein